MEGLIIKAISGEYTVINDKNESFVCKPRGTFRLKEDGIKVGDRVVIDEKTKSLLKIFPRKNELLRPYIANLDKVFLIFSVKEPELNLNLLDRLISIVEYNDMEIIIVFTKLDLLENKEEFDKINQYYRNIGYKTYTSGLGNINIDLLTDEINGSICTFAGQSGVGKSTLLNVFDDSLKLKTNEISQALGRGKHTTRHVELLKVHKGWVADTPGFGNVDFPFDDLLTFSQTFVEFFQNAKGCKYSRCLHIDEPNCYIKELVKIKEILPSRYENYLLFHKEIKEAIKSKY